MQSHRPTLRGLDARQQFHLLDHGQRFDCWTSTRDRPWTRVSIAWFFPLCREAASANRRGLSKAVRDYGGVRARKFFVLVEKDY
ncbi:MAG: hypothetical protein ACE5GQ_02065 [Nitrospinales bacterium]